MVDSLEYHRIIIDEFTVDRWLVILDHANAHVTANVHDMTNYLWLELLLQMKNLHKTNQMEIKDCDFIYRNGYVDQVHLKVAMPNHVYNENKLLGKL